MTKLLSTLVLSAALTLPALAGDPAPETKDVKTGTSTITFSSEVAELLNTAGIIFQKAQPARINPGKGALTYVASGGSVDLVDAKTEIIHSGGITLAKEIVNPSLQGGSKEPKQYKTATLLDPIIVQPESGAAAVLSAVIVVNGDSQGRVNVFNIAGGILTSPVSVPNNLKLSINDKDLALTAEAAAALNAALEVTAFQADQVVGSVDISVKFASSKL